MARIPVALFNYENGGRRSDGSYDFTGLQHAFAAVTEPPALILLCEAKHYRDHHGHGKYAAAEALSDELGVPYTIELGSSPRGPMPPAILYNPNLLVLRRWPDPADPHVFTDHRNVARFAIRDSTPTAEGRTEFLAWVHHLDPLSGDARLRQAQHLGRYGRAELLPVIGGGDLNATASGPHLPQRDWTTATIVHRIHKGLQQPDGSWTADTRALDYLIGAWDPHTGSRRDGAGYHAIAELAWRTNPDRPIAPTVHHNPAAGGPLLIDWLLVNDALCPHVIPDSYHVHSPDDRYRHPSDHLLVTAAFDL